MEMSSIHPTCIIGPYLTLANRSISNDFLDELFFGYNRVYKYEGVPK